MKRRKCDPSIQKSQNVAIVTTLKNFQVKFSHTFIVLNLSESTMYVVLVRLPDGTLDQPPLSSLTLREPPVRPEYDRSSRCEELVDGYLKNEL